MALAAENSRFPQGTYTCADYLEWDEDVRAEIIDGRVYMMSPPSP